MSKNRDRDRARLAKQLELEAKLKAEHPLFVVPMQPLTKPTGNFVRHSYDANGELISDATEL